MLNNKFAKGRIRTLEHRLKMQKYGSEHGRWKGINVSYNGLHKWVNKYLGNPNKCEHCGKIENNNRLINWANKSHEYKRDLTDWIRLCIMCHRKYDKLSTKS